MSASIPPSTLEQFTTFGDLLRFLRRRTGITQIELSIAVGYSDAQISRLEQNLRLPDIPTIQARFVSALGLENEPKAVARLLELAANVRREDAPGLGLCPYKGLNYFDEADADLFVGRESLTARLTDRLFSSTLGGSEIEMRFLAVVGASGSGKSSLVRAGLIPALRWNKASADWSIHILTPTAHPLESLASSLTNENASVLATAALMDDLSRDSRSLQIFTKRKLGSENYPRLLLVIDQFEELFTLCRSEEERTAFIDNLLTAASEADGPLVVIITLRADFYVHCANYIQLREALAQNQEYIGAMSDGELRRAIEEPARRGRWEFEPGLVDLLLHDVGHEPGALPLLSHALLETWQRRRSRTMTLSGYTSSGGVRGAIAETAEAVFIDQFTHEQQTIARRIFLRLTELGDETASGDTRRRAAFSELILKPEEKESTQNVLKALADSRLIITNADSAEVAHEALIREWPTLRGWLEDNREGLRLHRHMTEVAQEWIALDREADILYRGVRLSQAYEWASTHEAELNDLEREFLAASNELREREASEREAQRQRELEAAQKLAEMEGQRAEEQALNARQLSKRAKYLTGAFVIALFMAFTALFFGSQARQTAVTAQNERRIASARELAASSLNNLDLDPELSILLALQAVSTTRTVNGTVLPEAEEALHRSIIASPLRLSLSGHNAWVFGAAFSPDGNRLATIGRDGTTIVWDALTGEEVLRLPGTTVPSDNRTAQRIIYSPNGKLLAACDNSMVNIYDAESGKLIQTLSGHAAEVVAVAFSPDGKHLATGSMDTTVQIWDAASGTSLHILTDHTDILESLAFSPDGRWLATGSDDLSLKIWDADTGELLHNYSDFPDLVDSIAFSPDGTRLVFYGGNGLQVWSLTSNSDEGVTTITNEELLTIPGAAFPVFSPDGTQLAGSSGSAAKVWDVSTGREILTLVGHTNGVMGVAFSPDGKLLATTSMDETVKIWSITPGQEAITLADQGFRVAYSPDGTQLATEDANGTVTLWNAATGEAMQVLAGHNEVILGLAFSPGGKRFATASADATAIVWDTATGQKLLTLMGHEIAVRDIAFSPDGTRIATASFDETARVWDAATGKQLLNITGQNGIVLGVAFSPDGTRLATSGSDITAKIWDVKTGQLLFTLSGHTGVIPDITFSPDGSKIATGSGDGTAKMWDAVTGKELFTLAGHRAGILSVSFSPDGKLIATGSSDNTAKVWDAIPGQEMLTLPGYLSEVFGVAFSPLDGGAHLAVASSRVVRIYLLRIEELLTLAQTRVTRSLTAEECQKYLHIEQCPVVTP